MSHEREHCHFLAFGKVGTLHDMPATMNDEQFREYSLKGNLAKVIFQIGTPLAVYALSSGLFSILDTLMASYVSSTAVSSVAYLSQLQVIINSIGAGLVTGSIIKINQAYGAGDYQLVRKQLNTLVVLCLFLCMGILLLVPIIPQILTFFRTPEAFIKVGSNYFSILLLATMMNILNGLYFAVEKTRGKTKRIMGLNLVMMTIKIICSAFFIFVLQKDISSIATATLIAYLLVFTIGLSDLLRSKSVFRLNLRLASLRRDCVLPLVGISYPIALDKASFALGKTMVNSMITQYGNNTVGALGISNNTCGLTTNLQGGYCDGASAIISQNIGAGNKKRAIQAYLDTLLITCLVSALGITILYFFRVPLTTLFSTSRQGLDSEFQKAIMDIFRYDLVSCFPLAINSAAVAFLLGLGKTKLTLVINLLRIFVFRIPVLYLFQSILHLGQFSVGLMMMVSNTSVAAISTSLVMKEIHKLRKSYAKEHIKENLPPRQEPD
ncbi:MAG: MATE family efflux transporter [Sphaerochaetaceae bacterium]